MAETKQTNSLKRSFFLPISCYIHMQNFRTYNLPAVECLCPKVPQLAGVEACSSALAESMKASESRPGPGFNCWQVCKSVGCVPGG